MNIQSNDNLKSVKSWDSIEQLRIDNKRNLDKLPLRVQIVVLELIQISAPGFEGNEYGLLIHEALLIDLATP
jgi:hypothetical protein